MIVQRQDGSTWRLGPPVGTSDGFLLANGVLVDPDTEEALEDDDGFPIVHQFFIGRE